MPRPTRLVLSVALLVIATFARATSDERGRPLIQRFTSKEYKAHPQVWTAAQGPDGAMWFGTQGAVVEYDGNAWHRWSVPTPFVRQTTIGPDNAVYVGGEEVFGRLHREPDGTYGFESLLTSLPKDFGPIGLTRRIAATNDAVYAATDTSVFRWRDGQLHPWRLDGKRRSVVEVIGGRIFLIRGSEGILELRDEKFVPFANGSELAKSQFSFLLPPPPNTDAVALLGLGNDGLFLVSGAGRISPWPNAAADLLKPVQLFCGTRLPSGEYALGTVGGGAFLLSPDGRNFVQYQTGDGLTHDIVIGVGADRENGVWAATQNGISRIDHSTSATVFDASNGLGEGIVFDLLRHEDSLYVTFNDALLRLVPANGTTRAHWEREPRVPNDVRVRRALSTPHGLVMGGDDLWMLASDRAALIAKSTRGNITTFAASSRDPDRIFVAYDATVGSLRWQRDHWVDEGVIPGVDGVAHTVYEAPDGTLWAATDARGVYRLQYPKGEAPAQHPTVEHYFESAGLPAGHGWIFVQEGPFGVLFNSEKGPFRFNSETRQFEPEDRIRVKDDTHAYLYDGIGRGIDASDWWGTALVARPDPALPLVHGTLKPGDRNLVLSPAPTVLASFMGQSGLMALLGERNGVVWARGLDTLVRLEVGDAAVRPLHWKAIIRELRANGSVQPLGPTPPVIPYSTNPIVFSYAPGLFGGGAAPVFQTRLLGFRDEWSEFSPRNEVEFTNLIGGPFTLEVRVRDGNGRLSEPASVTFRVAPPWHRSALAYGLYGVVLLAAVVGFVRWRTAKSEGERRRLELLVTERTSQLKIAKEQADAANQAKSAFLANMSHELRTPLNGVIGYAQVLMKDREVSPRNRERLRIVQTSGEHLLRMINEVLDFSKIEAGKMELTTTPFHLPQLLRDVAAAASPRFEQKGLDFIFDPAGDLPDLVLGDPLKLRQVVDNLLSNAAKFTAKGSVRFNVRVVAPETFEFSVADTGVGISNADIARLYTPFQQAADGRPPEPGTGLGLAISQRIVGLMGAKLEVESRPGQGSRFFFVVKLPVIAESSEVRRTTGSLITGYHGPRRKLLVVDDVATNRDVLCELLTPLGFEMYEAASGDDALAMVPTLQPDAVFLDLRMPGIDGLEVARRLRVTEAGKRLKLFAMSASVLSFSREKAFAAGCDDFLPKPFREDDLLARLGLALQLEWVGNAEGNAKRRESATPFPAEASGLDAATIEALLAITQRGEISQLRNKLTTLPADPLVETLDGLAKTYRMERIREVLEAHLAKLRSQ